MQFFTLYFINYTSLTNICVYIYIFFFRSLFDQLSKFQVESMNRVYRFVLPIVILQQFPGRTTNFFSFSLFLSLFRSFLSFFSLVFLSLSLSLSRVNGHDRSVYARTRRQTDEGWEICHPSCRPMCKCRAHDLPLSLTDAPSFARRVSVPNALV